MPLNGMPIDKAATYRIVTNNFLQGGGDGFPAFTKGTDVYYGGLDIDAFADYLSAHSPYTPGPLTGSRSSRTTKPRRRARRRGFAASARGLAAIPATRRSERCDRTGVRDTFAVHRRRNGPVVHSSGSAVR